MYYVLQYQVAIEAFTLLVLGSCTRYSTTAPEWLLAALCHMTYDTRYEYVIPGIR